MENIIKNFRSYRWFYTSSDKLVVGGKSAEQNDFLLKTIKKSGKEFFIMHTKEPGSPFSVILSETSKVKKSDLEETAIFTASFSRAWKLGKKSANVDIFLSTGIRKSSGMKTGTWGVSEVLDSINAPLKIVLTTQSKILRAVPESVASKPLLKITPGKTDKTKLIGELKEKLNNKFLAEDILSALPAGGIEIK
jgi:hypothetical protein